MYKGHKIIDGHIHYMLDLEPDALVKFMDETGMDCANLASISHGTRLSCTLDALTLKALYPGRFYVCGSLDPCEYYRGGEDMGARLASYARRLISCGCDGIKLLEGKPQLRRALPVPDFDATCWEAFWTFMEETQTPLLWHVNDPEEFWDRSKVPLWAAKLGWEYDDTYINNEAQYAQVLTVLEHHPKLRVTFAHMFFLSAQLSRLSAILDRFANVMVDLTPGIEMYENLSLTPDETAVFFEKYHDRIIYGTDIGSRFVYNREDVPFNYRENIRRGEIVRDFLFERGTVTVRADGNFVKNRPDFKMECLGLNDVRLDEILSGNFLRFMGGAPRDTDRELILQECEFMKEESRRAELHGIAADTRGLELSVKYLR